MSQYTKGPWYWYSPQGSPATNPSGAAFLIGPTRLYMDKVCGFSVGDAVLIAAAPDLLHALQNIENDNGQIPDHAWKVIQDAIAKATTIQ